MLRLLVGPNWPAVRLCVAAREITLTFTAAVQVPAMPLCVYVCVCVCLWVRVCMCVFVCDQRLLSLPLICLHYSSPSYLSLSLSLLHPCVLSLSPSGEISTRVGLDREQQSSYQVLLVVQDGGTPPRSATGTAFITVLDENDNTPSFRHSQPGRGLTMQVILSLRPKWQPIPYIVCYF